MSPNSVELSVVGVSFTCAKSFIRPKLNISRISLMLQEVSGAHDNIFYFQRRRQSSHLCHSHMRTIRRNAAEGSQVIVRLIEHWDIYPSTASESNSQPTFHPKRETNTTTPQWQVIFTHWDHGLVALPFVSNLTEPRNTNSCCASPK